MSLRASLHLHLKGYAVSRDNSVEGSLQSGKIEQTEKYTTCQGRPRVTLRREGAKKIEFCMIVWAIKSTGWRAASVHANINPQAQAQPALQ